MLAVIGGFMVWALWGNAEIVNGLTEIFRALKNLVDTVSGGPGRFETAFLIGGAIGVAIAFLEWVSRPPPERPSGR